MRWTTKTTTAGMVGPRCVGRRRLSTVLRTTVFGVVAAVTVGLTSVQAQELSREYQLKAAFLFNFVRFVDWPPTSADPGFVSPLTVCTLGPDSVRDAFASLNGRQIRGRTIAVKHLETGDEIPVCAALFVEREAGSDLADLLRNSGGTPLLTVGEANGFVGAGGIIAFVYDRNELRFEIDLHAAERAGLNVRSELLTLATNIRRSTHPQ